MTLNAMLQSRNLQTSKMKMETTFNIFNLRLKAEVTSMHTELSDMKLLLQQILARQSKPSDPPSPQPSPRPSPPEPRRVATLERETSLRVQDLGPDRDDKLRYKKDNLPEIDTMIFSKPNHIGLVTALQHHFDDIHKELRQYRRNEEFVSRAGKNHILNDIFLKSLPAVLANPIKRRDEKMMLDMSFHDLKILVFAGSRAHRIWG